MKSRLWLLVLFVLGSALTAPLRAGVPSAIARVKPSVVVVGSFSNIGNPRFGMRGTGFVVAHGDGSTGNLVITNVHVLEEAADEEQSEILVVQIRTGPNEFEMRPASVLEVDPHHDLALLQFQGPPVPALRVRDSSLVQEGQAVAFMGFPIGGVLGFSSVTHHGMISSIVSSSEPSPTARQLSGPAIRNLRERASFQVFQLDGTAYPGNSGGPLFDPDSGDVLGVVSMVFVKGNRESALTSPSGISYAIPSGFVLKLLARNKTE